MARGRIKAPGSGIAKKGENSIMMAKYRRCKAQNGLFNFTTGACDLSGGKAAKKKKKR